MNNLNLVPMDIFFIVLALFFTFRCIIKGFISEFMAIASIAGGIIAGVLFSSSVSSIIDIYVGISRWNRIIAFLILFLAVYIIIKLLEKGIYDLIIKAGLEKLDRSLGLFLGLFESFIIIFLIVAVIEIQPFFVSDKILGGSIAADFMKKIFVVFYTYPVLPLNVKE